MLAKTEAPIHIVFAVDEGYAMPLAVSLYSTIKWLAAPAYTTIHLLDGGFTEKSRHRLEAICRRGGANFKWWKADDVLPAELLGTRHITKATYLRILLPKMLPATLGRVVFLDADILVCRDVTPLAKVDLGGKAIAAVRDYAVASVTHPFSGIKNWRELGLAPDLPCFNAGIMVMDLERWRQSNLVERVMSYIAEHQAQLGNCDQDALNAVLAANWQPLDFKWNVQYSLYYLETLVGPETIYDELRKRRRELTKEAAIFHFTGTPKPWNHWCGHPATFTWTMDLLRSGWFSPLQSLGWALNYWARRGVFFLTVWGGWRKLRERV